MGQEVCVCVCVCVCEGGGGGGGWGVDVAKLVERQVQCTTDAGWTLQCCKDLFSQSELSVQTLNLMHFTVLQYLHSSCVQITCIHIFACIKDPQQWHLSLSVMY